MSFSETFADLLFMVRPGYTVGDREKGHQVCPLQWKEYWQDVRRYGF